MRLVFAIAVFFSTPARQAAGWAGLGVLGLALTAGGLWLTLGGDDDGARLTAAPAASATPTRTPSSTSTPSPTPSPALVTPAPAPESTPRTQPASTDSEPVSQPATEPAPEPTERPAAVAGGPYCDNINPNTPPNSIFGLLTIAGTDAPAGTTVTMLFDGVAGPSVATAATGGYKINWAAGGGDCANRVGAAISISVNGQVFDSGSTVGGGGGTPVIRLNIAVP